MKVNIGKNTLGQGGKMTVGLREYGRSTSDLSFAWRSTMGVGTLVPFMKLIALPGDTFKINLENKILTDPTIGPLFGSFKFQADIFTCPIRLYNAMLHNNALNVGLDMKKVKLPKLKGINTGKNKKYGEISSSSLYNYLGLKEGEGVAQNAVPTLAYYDIFKNYYANKQEKKFPMYSGINPNRTITIEKTEIKKPGKYSDYFEFITFDKEVTDDLISETTFEFTKQNGATISIKGSNLKGSLISGRQWKSSDGASSPGDLTINTLLLVPVEGGDLPLKEESPNASVLSQAESIRKIELYDLEEIDLLREEILAAGRTEFWLENSKQKFLQSTIKIQTQKEDFGGLCLKTHQSDLFNNWVDKEWVEGSNGISAITKIDTSSGSFTMDTLNLAKKVYEMLNRIAISGGSYKDWIETVYTTDYYFRAETPVYEGGMSSEIEFEAITSLAASTADEYEPLGTLAGRGVNGERRGGSITIKVNEPSYIIGICSITPRVDYSQGVDWDNYLDTLDDLHKPQLDGIGYEDLMATLVDWRASGNMAIGKQPAWIKYTTNVNKTFGKFAVGEDKAFMVLNKIYETEGSEMLMGYSSYIEPESFNNIFATTGKQEQHFDVQIGCGIEARRVKSATEIPNF